MGWTGPGVPVGSSLVHQNQDAVGAEQCAEDGIRDAQESRGLGDVYKRQTFASSRGLFIPCQNLYVNIPNWGHHIFRGAVR